MSLVKWDPFREMEDLFDRYTKAVGWPLQGSQETTAAGDWAPRVNVAETNEAFFIEAEIPEVKKENVKVTLNNGVLTIQGERKREKEEKGKKYHKIERYYGTFSRSFTLPDNIDVAKIEGVFKDGMLKLEIPKTENVKAKEIEVQFK